MKRLVRLLLLFVVVLLLVQIPFVVSLFETARVRRYLQSVKPEPNSAAPFQDIRGGIHVHSAAGGHSMGTYAEIVRAAKKVGYRFVFITEHEKAHPILARRHDPELILIYGTERRTGDGGELLCAGESGPCFQTGEDREVRPEVVGLEVFNLHHSALLNDTWLNRISFLYHRIYGRELFFFKLWTVDRRYLESWDRALLRRPVAGIGGSDAHQNVGLVLKTAAGQQIFSLLLDPYEESFEAVTTHVLLEEREVVSEASILAALARGSAYIAFEKIADPTGFSFHTRVGGRLYPSGSTVGRGAVLVCHAPCEVDFVLIHNGGVWKQVAGTKLEVPVNETGFYRLEVYPQKPPRSLEGKPWIISNPVYVAENPGNM